MTMADLDIDPAVEEFRGDPNVNMDMEFIQRNPEAIFDYITVRSIQDRYGQSTRQKGRSKAPAYQKTNAQFQNELEFETFVQQFPIDDSIAECFAMTSDNDVIKQSSEKYLSGGKRPQGSTRYNKLKKKFGWKHSGDLASEDDSRSRESKRSKKGGVFSKRHKWRNLNNASVTSSKKSVNFSDQSEPETICDVMDAVNVNAVSSAYQNSGLEGLGFTDATSITDSHVTSFSDTLSRDTEQVVPQTKEDVYYSKPEKVSKWSHPSDPRELYGSHYRNDVTDVNTMSRDYFSTILSGNTSDMIQRMEDLQPEEAKRLRDDHGNTLLHRCVLLGNADAVKFLLEKYPDSTSDMNAENTTAVELAAKHGQYDCLKVMLDRGQKRRCLGSSLVNRLLNVSAQYGQSDCLSLLITYMSRDPHCAYSLPGDKRGNTAAHLAAKHGHLQCLQTLVAAGYDVTSENLMQQRPLHLAHQSRSQTCFEFLMVLNICAELMKALRSQSGCQLLHQEQLSSVRTSLEQVRVRLNLFRETHQAFMENKASILQTLNRLQEDLERFIKHTSSDSAAKRFEARQKLDELNGEIERLEDTFDFSPVSGTDEAMDRLFSSLDEAIQTTDSADKTNDNTFDRNISLSEENIGASLSSLVKDVHREFVLENWNIKPVLDKHFGVTPAEPTPPPSPVESEVIYSDIAFTRTECEHLDKKNEPEKLPKRQEGNENLNTDTSDERVDKLLDKLAWKGLVEGPSSGNLKVGQGSTQAGSSNLKDKDGTLADITNLHPAKPLNRHKVEATYEPGAKGTNQSLSQKGVHENKQRVGESHDGVENIAPTERPFTRLMSLEERMNMLIAGEREKEKLSDAENGLLPVKGHGGSDSQYTNSFTSITSESTSGTSDWFGKVDFASLDTSASTHDDVVPSFDDVTSSSASYWWDAGVVERERVNGAPYKVTTTFEEDIRNRVHLNLGNDDSSYEELRAQRLAEHLRSIQQSRYLTDNFREQITTSTGEVMGGFRPVTATRDRKIVVDVHGALSNRPVMPVKPKPKPRKDGQELFSLEDAIATSSYMDQSKYREVFSRSHDHSLTSPPWNEHFDEPDSDVPWYDMNDYVTNRGRHWESDSTSSAESHTPQSYV